MGINLEGQWFVRLENDGGIQSGVITIPGTLQGQGYGNRINPLTPWVSSLHDPDWAEREEYRYGQEKAYKVPFLAQPQRHFIGEADYTRIVSLDKTDDYYLYIERSRWRTRVRVDQGDESVFTSLCVPHVHYLGRLEAGAHKLTVTVDNRHLYPYRPDGHGVSDALGGSWNGMAGEVVILTADEWQNRQKMRKAYAKANPVSASIADGNFIVNGKPFYFRATHMGGEAPLTGYPPCDRDWWARIFRIVKLWGLNAVRFHSFCPPEAAFYAADEVGVYLLVECAMWNTFNEGIPMLDILDRESRLILEHYGHHPSFLMFSSGNEPGGDWYGPLKAWVKRIKAYDQALGYGGRRFITAQSGWFYDCPPAALNAADMDFIYFHRSAYGPLLGGRVRGREGWFDRDYQCSIEGASLPVICHELGQWCAYPDYRQIEKFTAYLSPSNLELFRAQAEIAGLLPLAEDFLYCSGLQQLRFYKQDIEANYRTAGLKGYELLDLHDYIGQCGALVGVLDVFWDNKGYASPDSFREFCDDTVLLAYFSSYVYKQEDRIELPIAVSHYGSPLSSAVRVSWQILDGDKLCREGCILCAAIPSGATTVIARLSLDCQGLPAGRKLNFRLYLSDGDKCAQNHWPFYIFAQQNLSRRQGAYVHTRVWTEAKQALEEGRSVLYEPLMEDLNYECPPLTAEGPFWNSQMGPTWSRNLGLVIQDGHPLFQNFPTQRYADWQWDEIMQQGRAFHLPQTSSYTPIVRVIDDWNRHLSLGLLFEAQVSRGKLMVVSADLSGGFASRPAATALRQAIAAYVGSDQFRPSQRLKIEQIESALWPVRRMLDLTRRVTYKASGTDRLEVQDPEALLQASPEPVTVIKGELPIDVCLHFAAPLSVQGLLYFPDQKRRVRRGQIKDYEILIPQVQGGLEKITDGTLLNTSLSQELHLEKTVHTDTLILRIKSIYGSERFTQWFGNTDGWYQREVQMQSEAVIAVLHVRLTKEASAVYDAVHKPNDGSLFCDGAQRTATAEIEQ